MTRVDILSFGVRFADNQEAFLTGMKEMKEMKEMKQMKGMRVRKSATISRPFAG